MSLLKAYLQNPRTQRVLNSKPGEKGFSLIELVVVIAVLAVLIVIALPNFQGVTDDAAASAGKKWLVDAYTECTVARTRGQAASTNITAPSINGGTFSNTAAVTCPTAIGTSNTFTPALTRSQPLQLITTQEPKPVTSEVMPQAVAHNASHCLDAIDGEPLESLPLRDI